jgi:DNA-binding NarL/FixJ family response regulator
MEKINVFLVDDHDLVRDGLKALLSGISDIMIIGEAATGGSLFEKLKTIQPDVLVLDISLPDISGIEITRRITSEYPAIKVLILSMYTNEDFISNALKAGAIGYLPKNTTRQELLHAIYAVNNNEEYFGETISKILLQNYVRSTKETDKDELFRAESLSRREVEILRLFLEGMLNKEIGETLGISIRTVETHKNHIMKKLGCKSTVEMLKFAIRNKLVKL